jgi:ABC-type transport system involved in multi-copper enzyme maturation permease subunit
LVRARQTLIGLLFLCFAGLAVVAWSLRGERTAAEFIEQVFLVVYVPFLLPLYCLSHATAVVASDREDGTLVYLLVTPLPRSVILAAKAAAALLLSLAWTVGSLALLCYLAGSAGAEAFAAVWPGICWSTTAYVALFLFLGVLFRRATIIALAYALFLEAFLGNVPGIAKRVTVSFYARCLIFDSSAQLGVSPSGPFNPELFLPVSGSAAQWALWSISGVLLLASLWVFSCREYT